MLMHNKYRLQLIPLQVAINDNDALELSIAGFTITETEATQTANFTVTSNIAAEEDIVFTFTTADATAVDGNDYTAQALLRVIPY